MNTISLDGYVIVKQDDLQTLLANQSKIPLVVDPARGAGHAAVEDPACPASGACPEVPGRCGAKPGPTAISPPYPFSPNHAIM